MACREKDYAQVLVDINAIAKARGDKFGVCDCVDNSGNPYPSGWLEKLIEEAETLLKLTPKYIRKPIAAKWSTEGQWK